MGSSRNPFRGKRRGFDASGKAPRNKKLSKGSHSAPDNSRPRKRRSGWGLVGLLSTVAAGFLLSVLKISSKRRKQVAVDRSLLSSILAQPLRYTEHAACRMDCRHIPAHEVTESLRTGNINRRKSEPGLQPCPKYVVDAQVGTKQKNVQVVVSACRAHTDVVTVIDKDNNWACFCP